MYIGTYDITIGDDGIFDVPEAFAENFAEGDTYYVYFRGDCNEGELSFIYRFEEFKFPDENLLCVEKVSNNKKFKLPKEYLGYNNSWFLNGLLHEFELSNLQFQSKRDYTVEDIASIIDELDF